MADEIRGVPISELPDLGSVPDDSLLVMEFLGKAYSVAGGALRQLVEAIFEAMGGSFDDVTEERLKKAIEAVLADGKYNGVSPIVEIIDTEDGEAVMRITDAFGSKDYPVAVMGAASAVQYVEQELTEEQKAQARKNIGLIGIGKNGSSSSISQKKFVDLSGKGTQVTVHNETVNEDGSTTTTATPFKIYDGRAGLHGNDVSLKITRSEDPPGWNVSTRYTVYNENGSSVQDGEIYLLPDAKSAYEAAKDGGYTEEESTFNDMLAKNNNTVKADGMEYIPGERKLFLSSGGVRISEPIVIDVGADSLSVGIDKIEGGHRITFTDANGEKSFDVMDGTSGSSGVSPSVNIDSIEGGTRITVTDANGAKSFDVMNGADGDPGNRVQSDYAEKDTDSPAYILNRTHWKEVEPMVGLFNRNDVGYEYTQADHIGLEDGEIYEVYFDGNTYDAVGEAYAANGETGVTLKATSGTNLGFTIVDFSPETAAKNGYGLRITKPISQHSTIAIIGPRITWHKLDRSYLPAELGNVKTVNDQLPDQYGNVQVDVGVKTVNGQTPDEDGNVEIEVGGSGGGTVQADMAENDPNAAGYVKNRTHWRELELGEAIIDTSVSLTFQTSKTVTGSVADGLTQGSTYRVVWGGAEYNCVCGVSGANEPYLGNLALHDTSAEATDDPFCIVSMGGTSYKVIRKVAGTYTLTVQALISEVWHKLDKRYLPNDLGGVKTVNGQTPDENGNVEVEGVTDYNKLENKPVGADVVEPLTETTVEIDPDAGYAEFMATVPLVARQTYTVKYNGVDYECVCSTMTNEVTFYLLGNSGAVLGGDDTGEPFVFISIPDEGTCGIFALDGSTSATLSITGEIVKKLDIKYLPEGYPYKTAETVEVFPETTVDGRGASNVISAVTDVNTGGKYTVKWNGVEYPCVAMPYVMEGSFVGAVLGDLSALSDDVASTGEPFACCFLTADAAAVFGIGGVIVGLDDSETATLSITGIGEVIRPIANEYLEPFTVVPGQAYEEVLAEQTMVTNSHDLISGGRAYYQIIDGALPLMEGATYIVEYDGVPYECTCKAFRATDDPIFYLGNLTVVLNGDATAENEPFAIGSEWPDGNTVLFAFHTSDSDMPDVGENVTHTFRVYSPETKGGAKLKPECLPTDCVTNQQLDSKGYVTETALSNKGYVTETALSNKGYVTETALSNKGYLTGTNPTVTGSFTLGARKEGSLTGAMSFAVGENVTASGLHSHATGAGTTASGINSHAEGFSATASGERSHAEGESSIASGVASHAEGCLTEAKGDYQHVQGRYNAINANLAHIVGNGTSGGKRSNAHTLDWDGNAWYAGDVYVGGTGKDDTAAAKLMREIPVTSADNGKFLRVVDGAWAAVSLTDVSEVGA